MTRKPQIAWGLRVRDARGPYIDPSSIRWLRKDAVSAFWRDRENYHPEVRAIVEQRFENGAYRFVKVQIIPVEGEDD